MAVLSLRSLLVNRGRLLLSLPASRGDPLVDHRDADGRLFTPYTPEEVSLLFERFGFRAIGQWSTEDSLARQGTSWHTLLFELQGQGTQRPIDRIETILNRDRKEATYKLALIRALAGIATQEARCASWQGNRQVGVPIDRIAQRWLLYYWPIMAWGRGVPQSKSEGADGKPLKFRASLTALIEAFQGQGQHGGLTAWHLAMSRAHAFGLACHVGICPFFSRTRVQLGRWDERVTSIRKRNLSQWASRHSTAVGWQFFAHLSRWVPLRTW